MNQNTFLAQNELEAMLITALDGGVPEDDFMRQLIDAQVFMPIQDEVDKIKGFQRTTRAQPLVIEDEEGTKVLILFTSPGRAREFVLDHAGYGGGLLTELSWVLRKMDAPISIALNPGFEVGFDMDIDMVAEMIANLPPESEA